MFLVELPTISCLTIHIWWVINPDYLIN